MTKGFAPFSIVEASEFDARTVTALPANSQRMGFDSKAWTRLLGNARIMQTIKRRLKIHLDDTIARSRLDGRQSISPTQPSYQQRRKDKVEKDPKQNALERAAQGKRRMARTAPGAG